MRSFLIAGSVFAVVALVAASSRDAVADDPPCDAWEVEYGLSGTLAVRDTPMGAGNADHSIGPGTATLRFDNATGPGDGPAKLLSFTMKEFYTGVYFSTKITTDLATVITPATCSAGEGTFAGGKITWAGKVRGYKVDGFLTCDGSLCGKFGGPPQGKSEYHDAAHDVDFAPFVFSADRKTFTMTASQVSKGESPKHTTYLAMAGRETKRTCVRQKPCK